MITQIKSLPKGLTLILIVCLFANCTNSESSSTAKATVQQPPIESKAKPSKLRTFQTIKAEPRDVAKRIEATGRVIPLQKIEVRAEVQGVLLQNPKPFKTGVTFRKGEPLIKIDKKQFLENLKAQRSQLLSALVRIMSDLENDYPDAHPAWNAYLENFQVDQIVAPLPEVNDNRLKYFLSARNIFNTYHSIKSLEENLPKYQIDAPFTGVVMASNVDPGALITPQMPLGEFNRTDVYEIEASVATTDIEYIKLGQVFNLSEVDRKKVYKARVNRIGKRIDPATQTVKIYLRASDASLRENMYLEGFFEGEMLKNVVPLPQEIITSENQVHVIADSIVQLQDIQPRGYASNKVFVSGLQAGDVVIREVVNAPIEGIRAQPE